MREIKFRAWGAYDKLMNDDVTYIKEYETGVNPWIYMQFTGLHDKNGKEIYEGDIVQWKKSLGCGVVCMATLYEGDDRARTGWVVDDCFVDDKCKIIGNIYESPDLIHKGERG